MALALRYSFSLEGIADGWTADCVLTYKGVTYEEIKAFRDSLPKDDKKTDDRDAAFELAGASIKLMTDFIISHFVSGKGMVEGDNGEQVLGDLTKDDIADLPGETKGAIFAKMTGQDSDPKGETTTTAS